MTTESAFIVVTKAGEYLVPSIHDAHDTLDARGDTSSVIRITSDPRLTGVWRYRRSSAEAWGGWPGVRP